MKEYIKLCNYILKNGIYKNDRTNTGTLSTFGYQMEIDVSNHFPLLTTKKMYVRAIIHELLWFISGDTNIRYLVDNNVRIWNEWPYKKYKNSKSYNGETIEEFVDKIKECEVFAKKWGDLGPVYGKQWRNFSGVDQLKNLIEEIKKNPNSRRLIISAWNPKDVGEMLLPPCHAFMQFYVVNKKISCKLYQRSADVFLGVPFNIASYTLFLYLIAKQTNLKPDKFIHTFGDAHIYKNHIDLIKLQAKRKPMELCKVVINDDVKSIFDYKYDDIKIVDYVSHPYIKGIVSV